MKLIYSYLIFGIVWGSFAFPHSVVFKSLAQEVKSSEKACREYSSQLESTSELDTTGERLIKTDPGRNILKKISIKDGTPRAYRKMLTLATETITNLNENDLTFFFWENAPCTSIHAESLAFHGLINSLKQASLNLDLKKQAVNLTLEYLKQRSEVSGIFLERVAQMEILKRLLGSQYVSGDSAQFVRLKKKMENWQRQLNSLNTSKPEWPASSGDFAKVSTQQKTKYLEIFKTELRISEQARKEFQSVLKTLQSNLI